MHATFFLVGEQVARNPSLAAEIVAAGHGIGLHCDRHRNQLRLGPRAVRADIERGAARIEETTGRPIERYRPPYGIFNATSLALVHRNGWRPLLWTHWGRDWEARATPESITERLVGGAVAEGSVLLLHDADDYSAPRVLAAHASPPFRACSQRSSGARAALDARASQRPVAHAACRAAARR